MESVLKKVIDFRATNSPLKDIRNIVGMGLKYGKNKIGVSLTTDNLQKVYHLTVIQNYKDGKPRTIQDIFHELTRLMLHHQVDFVAIGGGHCSSPNEEFNSKSHVAPLIEHMEAKLPEGIFLQTLNEFGTTKVAKYTFGRVFTDEEKQRISKTWRGYWCAKEASTYVLVDCIARDSYYPEYRSITSTLCFPQ